MTWCEFTSYTEAQNWLNITFTEYHLFIIAFEYELYTSLHFI